MFKVETINLLYSLLTDNPSFRNLEFLDKGESVLKFSAKNTQGEKVILRIFPIKDLDQSRIIREQYILKMLNEVYSNDLINYIWKKFHIKFSFPKIIDSFKINDTWICNVVLFIHGTPIDTLNKEYLFNVLKQETSLILNVLGALHEVLAKITLPEDNTLQFIFENLLMFNLDLNMTALNSLDSRYIKRFQSLFLRNKLVIRQFLEDDLQFIHGDFHLGNLIIQNFNEFRKVNFKGPVHIGVIDWEYSTYASKYLDYAYFDQYTQGPTEYIRKSIPQEKVTISYFISSAAMAFWYIVNQPNSQLDIGKWLDEMEKFSV